MDFSGEFQFYPAPAKNKMVSLFGKPPVKCMDMQSITGHPAGWF
jgi:hypothetical protein